MNRKAYLIRCGVDNAYVAPDGTPYFLVANQDEFTPIELAEFDKW